MTEAPRIDVVAAHRKVAEGEALLICAYEDESRCNRIRLDGSLTMNDLEEVLAWLPKNKELIFYCT